MALAHTTSKVHLVQNCFHSHCIASFFNINYSCAEELPNAEAGQDVQEFLFKFRNAAINNDINKIVLMTNFPFKTRGYIDSDPYLKHDKKWFVKNIKILLSSDSGLTIKNDTMLSLITRTDKIENKYMDGNNSLRLGNFVFKKNNDKWFFVMAYWENQ